MELNKNGTSKYVIVTKKSYSTLKAMAKDELIELLGIAQHNYECVNETLCNINKHAVKLDNALDKACELLSHFEACYPIYDFDESLSISCQESCTNDAKKCWREYLLKGDNE